jgi:hypothetical protein
MALGGLLFLFSREHVLLGGTSRAVCTLATVDAGNVFKLVAAWIISTQPPPSPCCLRMMSHVVGAPGKRALRGMAESLSSIVF